MKKLISVLLCVAMMFTFLTVISSAADAAAPAADGAETIFNMLLQLLAGVKWEEILAMLATTIQTLLRIIGAA